MRRSRKECLISTMRWGTLFLSFFFPTGTSPFLFSFLRVSSRLFLSLFSLLPLVFPLSVVFQQCVWFAMLPFSSKRRGKKFSLLPLTPAKQNSLRSSSPLLYFPLLLFLPSFPPLLLPLSIAVSLSHSLLASCQLINSSHPTRSQSFGKKTNPQPASQSVSCLFSQSLSLPFSQPDGNLLRGTVLQAGKSRHQAYQQVCTCQ